MKWVRGGTRVRGEQARGRGGGDASEGTRVCASGRGNDGGCSAAPHGGRGVGSHVVEGGLAKDGTRANADEGGQQERCPEQPDARRQAVVQAAEPRQVVEQPTRCERVRGEGTSQRGGEEEGGGRRIKGGEGGTARESRWGNTPGEGGARTCVDPVGEIVLVRDGRRHQQESQDGHQQVGHAHKVV